MLLNNIKIALRTSAKNRLFTVINVGGLAIGLAASLLLGLYVYSELSFDRFHQNADRMVRVVFRADINGGKVREPFAMPPVAAALRSDFPEVQNTTRLRNAHTMTVLHNNQTFRDAKMAFVDPNFFEFFTLPVVNGSPRRGLEQTNAVVLSETWAKRLFGAENAVGKSFTMKNWRDPVQVVAVMKDIPANSHFQFDILHTMTGMPEAQSDSWMQSEFYTYVLLPENYNYRQLEAKLPQLLDKNMGPQFQAGMGVSLSEFRQAGNQIGLFLQPLTDIHLHSDFTFDLSPGGDVRYVWLFGSVAVFLLLIACINFMNLSTASAARRAKEVGVRKAIGSSKAGLMGQFFTESILLSAVSFALALGVVYVALPYFRSFTGLALPLGFAGTPAFAALMLAFMLLVGLVAGSYPAVLLSGFKPVSVLKGGTTTSGFHAGLRRGLVVFQFVISVVLMIATTVVYRQLQFIQEKKAGYDRTNVLVLENSGVLGQQEGAFREWLAQDTRVQGITTSTFKPAGPSNNNNSVVYPDGKSDQMMRTLRYSVDEHYIPVLGMKVLQGRNFSREFGTDSSAIIINQATAKAFGWNEAEAIGHQLTWTNRKKPGSTYTVVGVVEDFHYKSMHEAIAPLVMVLEPGGGLILKVKSGEAAPLLSAIEQQWKQTGTDEPLDYAFMDDYFIRTYAAEQKTGVLMAIFAGLTIFIAALGLFGLAVFAAQRRVKEIGVRKVMGASVLGITGLLAKEFLQLVALAIVIATPIAWYLMQRWLSDFAYRIQIEWWVFLVAGSGAIVIALLTVGFQSYKAALVNPVESLRGE